MKLPAGIKMHQFLSDMGLTFLDFFAGVGGFRRGMELAGHACAGFCEYDKFAVASYTSMHLITDEQREYLETLDYRKRQQEILKEEYRNGEWYANDIRSVDARCLPKSDCWCFGFPCQDISVAGRQLGFAGHRSSLFFAVTKLIKDLDAESRPSLVFIENVKNLLSVNGGFDYARLLIELDEIGYDAEWAVLNSKDHGVPQNRERIFIIGHFRGRGTREVFPLQGTASQNRIRQMIGGSQSERLYNPDGLSVALTGESGGGGVRTGLYAVLAFAAKKDEAFQMEDVAGCIDANYYKGLGCNQPRTGVLVAGNVNPSGRGMNGNVFDSDGLAPVLTTNKGEGNKIAIPILSPDKEETRQNGRRVKDDGDPMFCLTVQDRHGVIVLDDTQEFDGTRIYEDITPTLRTQRCGLKVTVREAVSSQVPEPVIRGGLQAHQRPRSDGIAPALTSAMGMGGGQTPVLEQGVRIRRLTPRECFRLQAWTDEYFDRAAFVNGDSQLYKQAGNGVTVSVIEAIAAELGYILSARRERNDGT